MSIGVQKFQVVIFKIDSKSNIVNMSKHDMTTDPIVGGYTVGRALNSRQ